MTPDDAATDAGTDGAPTREQRRATNEFGMVVGTYEEGLTYVGRVGEVRFSSVDVNEAMVRQFVSSVQDPNPIYWDKDLAVELHGSAVAPPATLVSWGTNPRWQPDYLPEPPVALVVGVPLPGDAMINFSIEIEFFDQIRIGDRLNVVEEVEAISPEKETKLGPGHFITVVSRYRRQNGELVALQRNVMLRHSTKDAR